MEPPLAMAAGHRYRIADLPNRRPTEFLVEPDAAARTALATGLGILDIRKLRFSGTLFPQGARDWRLEADLGATVVQSCVVTLDPVTTRIDETVERSYLADWSDETGAEVEIPEDVGAEPLPAVLDLAEVMTEALALALPAFPRKDDAELGEAIYAEPGTAPMTDEDAKPFAALGSFRESLEKKGRDGN